MLVSKKDRIAVYSYLFKEGVLVCEKNPRTDFKVSEDEDGNDVTVRNLEVYKMMQSLQSRGLVKITFNWQWYYVYLTDEGIDYLRKYLNLPAEIVPLTFKKSAVARPRPHGGYRGDGDRPRRGFKGKDGAPDNFRPGFRRGGGFGRGGDAPASE